MPAGWGLIELAKNGLKIKKHAQWRDVGDPPVWFVASLARRVGLPPPELPAAVWLLAGREVDEAALIAAAGERMDYVRMKVREEVRAEMYEDMAFKNMVRLERVIKDMLGWQYSDPDKLAAWLGQAKAGGALAKRDVMKIILARDTLDRLLAEWGRLGES